MRIIIPRPSPTCLVFNSLPPRLDTTACRRSAAVVAHYVMSSCRWHCTLFCEGTVLIVSDIRLRPGTT